MLHKLRPRITYANVVATLALFVALGGTTYAAATIGTSDIKNNAVTNPKLAPASVGGGKVIDGSLAWSDLGGSLRTVVKGRCPLDSGSPMDVIGLGGTLCMDRFAHGPAYQINALRQCAKAGLHLASTTEMLMAAEAGRLNDETEYWTDFIEDDGNGGQLMRVAGWTEEEHGGSFFVARHDSLKRYYVCFGLPMHG